MIQRLALLALLAASASAQESVWVVDPAGTGDFLEIADALLHTGEGWTLVVKPGIYLQPVVIANQGLTIVTDGPGLYALAEPLVVRDLGLTRDVIVSGLQLWGGFRVEDCNGIVQFQDCETVPLASGALPPTGTMYFEWPACGIGLSNAMVQDSNAVTFKDCTLAGSNGIDMFGYDGTPGEHGLFVENSHVALYDCTVTGGEGGSALSPGHFPVASGAGGDGIRVLGQTASVHMCDTSLAAGLGGTFLPGGNGSFGVTFGCDGQVVNADNLASMQQCAHPALSFHTNALVRGGSQETFTVNGPSGALVYLIRSNEPFWRQLPANVGLLHLQSPLNLTLLGTIPVSGTLQSTWWHPGPTSINSMVSLQYQVFAAHQGTRFLSGPRRTVVVNASL